MPVRRPQSHFVMFVFGCLVTSAMAVLPAGLAAAAPSSQVSVSISKLPGTFTAGGKAGTFESTARASNETEVYRQYVIRLTGLMAASVKAEKQTDGDHWVTLTTIAASAGVVTVREDVSQVSTSRVRLTFGPKTPPGRATITMEAYDERDQKLLGRTSAYQTTIMKAAATSGSASASGSVSGPVSAPVASASAEPVGVVPSPAAVQQRPELPVAGTSGPLLGLGALMVFGGLAGVIVLALVSGRTKESAPKEEPTR